MKSTGVVRKVDELGRIVLPIELRKMMDINVKDAVEILRTGTVLCLKSINLRAYFAEMREMWCILTASVFAAIVSNP